MSPPPQSFKSGSPSYPCSCGRYVKAPMRCKASTPPVPCHRGWSSPGNPCLAVSSTYDSHCALKVQNVV